jgi:hypothetical protein
VAADGRHDIEEGDSDHAEAFAALLVSLVFVLPVAGVVTANSGPTMAQFKKLQRQVKQLDQHVDAMEDRVAALEAAPTAPCAGTLGVAEYDGYVYDLYDPFETTALSLPDAGDLADWQVLIKTC